MNEVMWVFLNPCTLLLLPALWFFFWYRKRHRPADKPVRDTRRVDDGWMDR